MSLRKVPPGFPMQVLCFNHDAQITTTATIFDFLAPQDMTIVGLHATGTFDRTTGDETYVLSVEDATVKVSTNGAAIASPTGQKAIECTFGDGGHHVDAGDRIEIILTNGGTTPTVDGFTAFLQVLWD